MTGLDPTRDTILSIACFITASDLTLLDPAGYTAVISHPAVALSAMNPWCIDVHGRSGLTAACLASQTTAALASADLLAYIQRHVPQPGVALLAGNSVHVDKMFLAREPWAAVLAHLHYRILDVSSLKEAARRWAPEGMLTGMPRKEGKHEARADILESIAEARFYKERFFAGSGE